MAKKSLKYQLERCEELIEQATQLTNCYFNVSAIDFGSREEFENYHSELRSLIFGVKMSYRHVFANEKGRPVDKLRLKRDIISLTGLGPNPSIVENIPDLKSCERIFEAVAHNRISDIKTARGSKSRYKRDDADFSFRPQSSWPLTLLQMCLILKYEIEAIRELNRPRFRAEANPVDYQAHPNMGMF